MCPAKYDAWTMSHLLHAQRRYRRMRSTHRLTHAPGDLPIDVLVEPPAGFGGLRNFRPPPQLLQKSKGMAACLGVDFIEVACEPPQTEPFGTSSCPAERRNWPLLCSEIILLRRTKDDLT